MITANTSYRHGYWTFTADCFDDYHDNCILPIYCWDIVIALWPRMTILMITRLNRQYERLSWVLYPTCKIMSMVSMVTVHYLYQIITMVTRPFLKDTSQVYHTCRYALSWLRPVQCLLWVEPCGLKMDEVNLLYRKGLMVDLGRGELPEHCMTCIGVNLW